VNGENGERATGSFYRPELDGLRALAFLAVFVGHALSQAPGFWEARAGEAVGPWLAAAVRGGRFGVDLFFVLSAYLITEILLRERHARGTIDVRAFWVRRILRIWPLYFVFVAASLLIAPRIMKVEALSPGYAVAFLAFAGNWAIALHGFQPSVLMHLWSVSIEEQFYLTWPLVTHGLSPRRLRIATLCLVPIAVATRVYLIAAHGSGLDDAVWCNTVARLDPIAVGALLAMALRGGFPALGRGAARLALVLGASVTLVIVRYDAIFTHPVAGSLAYTAIALGCAAMLVGAMSLGARSLLATPALVYLGRISYGLYVFHFFFVRFASQYFTFAAAPLVTFALTLAFAAASYRWLETPFLRLKQRFTRGSPTSRAAAGQTAAREARDPAALRG
jgi:peptidoglycan/LPS O-acetylase OafA/YrhL